MKQVLDASGSELAPPTSMPGASRRVFLGVDSDLGPAVRIGFVNLDLKPFVRTDLVAYMHRIIASGSFSSSQASKLRGGLGWTATVAYGKCGRIGHFALTQRQYFDHTTEIEVVLSLGFVLPSCPSPPPSHILVWVGRWG